MTATHLLAPRAIILGDSISSGVYANSGVANPAKLWVNRLPSEVGIAVSNLSSPGMTVASPGGSLFGLSANLNAITMSAGFAGAKWAIITAGTNDTSTYAISLVDYIESYRRVVAHCRSLGLITVVISPLWRGDIAATKPHVGGDCSFEAFRVYGLMMAFEERAKPGPPVHVFDGLDAQLKPCHFHDDMLHPNESGQAILFDFIVSKMRSVGYWAA